MTDPSLDHLPIFLRVVGERVVVVGGGIVAGRKVEMLRRAGAAITIVAPRLDDDLHALVSQGVVRHIAARFEAAHLEGARLVIAATDDGAVNAAVSAESQRRNIPVNVVDDLHASTFIVPSIVDRSPVIVAIGSSGTAPVLARGLREKIEALLPVRFGALARFAAARRERVRNALEQPARRPFWERVLDGPIGTRVLEGQDEAAAVAFDVALSETSAGATDPERSTVGEVYLIGAGPGDPGLLTLKALQLLQRADVVLYDRLVSPAVVDLARRDARRIDVGKAPGAPQPAQEAITAQLVSLAKQGLRVARLKGGDPFIFGRGGEEIETLASAGIPFTVVPGITAAIGAAAASGMPLTHRKVARSVTFVTAHTVDDDETDWSALARDGQTVVFYMGVSQLAQVSAKLQAAGAPSTRAAAIVERATLPTQRVLRGTLATIADDARREAVEAPALLLVGDAMAQGADPAAVIQMRQRSDKA